MKTVGLTTFIDLLLKVVTPTVRQIPYLDGFLESRQVILFEGKETSNIGDSNLSSIAARRTQPNMSVE